MSVTNRREEARACTKEVRSGHRQERAPNLVLAVVDGDDAAWEALVDRFAGPVGPSGRVRMPPLGGLGSRRVAPGDAEVTTRTGRRASSPPLGPLASRPTCPGHC